MPDRRVQPHLKTILYLTFSVFLCVILSLLYDLVAARPVLSSGIVGPLLCGYGAILEVLEINARIQNFRKYGWRTMFTYYKRYISSSLFSLPWNFERPCLDCIHLGRTCPECASFGGDSAVQRRRRMW